MLPFKNNWEQIWKPHQENKICSTLLIPKNTLMTLKKEETVYIFKLNDIAKPIYRLPSQPARNVPGIFAECSLGVAMFRASREHLGNMLK